jgi:hypothetical protein
MVQKVMPFDEPFPTLLEIAGHRFRDPPSLGIDMLVYSKVSGVRYQKLLLLYSQRIPIEVLPFDLLEIKVFIIL